MEAKERREVAVYARVSKINNVWMRSEMKKLKYKSFSEYLDAKISAERKPVKSDSKSKRFSASR